MKMLELTIWGCKRLMLKQIDHIQVTFDSNQQIIIGTNGAGKSTLMRECSPLPPNPSDFTKKGGKIAVCENKGSIYRLESDFSKAPHAHKFYKDNVNLNDGGTVTVQKELVKAHFGLTQDLFDVLVGDEVFTAMPALKRRDWILRISGSDLEYAMKVYKQLRNKHRDAQAMVRHYAKRLSEEKVGLVSDEELVEINTKISTIKDELEILYKNRINNIPPLDNIKTKLKSLAETISYNLNFGISKDIPVPNLITKDVNSISDVNRLVGKIQSDLLNKENKLAELYKNANSFRDIIEALEVNSNGDMEKLKEQIDKDTMELISLESISNTNFNDFKMPNGDINVHKGIYEGIYPELIDIFNELPNNTNGKFTKEKKEENEASIEQLNRNLRTMSAKIGEIEHLIKHIKGIESIDCPKCSHAFKPGVSQDDLPRYEEQLIALKADIIVGEKRLEILMKYQRELMEYIEKTKRYRRIVKNNPELNDLWDCIFNLEDFIKKPSAVFPVLTKYLQVNDLWIKISNLRSSLLNSQSLYDNVKKVTDQHGVVNANQLKELNINIENTINEVAKLKRDLNDIVSYSNNLNIIFSTKDKLTGDIDEYVKLTNQAISAARNQCIDYDISIRNAEVATLTKYINDAKTAKSLVDELDSQKAKVEKELEAYAILVDEISPSCGLIAKYIKDFIDVFIEQMNIIISQIWTYDFKVLSCGVEDNEVTCKFPLSIEGGSITTPDVSKASSSQVDIVNFAFKIVLMYYLKLSDYPIYLDELAPSLDEKHRENILHFVDEFVTGKQCSQMFMISHYVAQHSIFENAEICVLADDNLMSLPDSYNHHVIINHNGGHLKRAA